MGRSYYVFSSGRIRRHENTLQVEFKRDGEIVKKSIPIEDVEEVFLFGEVDLNSKLLGFLSKNDVVLHFFNHYGYYTGSFYPREKHPSGYVIVKQVEHYLDPEKRLKLARKFVEASLHNMRRLLQKKGKNDIAEKIKEYEELLKETEEVPELMVHEAHARRVYYSVWEDITSWKFNSREIRPPSNELNALISFGNSLVYSEILKEIYKTPLNPTVSYLHEPSEKRFSLSLDVAEVFKPVFGDKLIFRLISQNRLSTEKHFIKESGGTFLNEEGRRVFVEEFERTLEETILHRTLKRKVKYRSLIRLELYKILKHIIGEKEYKPLKVWW